MAGDWGANDWTAAASTGGGNNWEAPKPDWQAPKETYGGSGGADWQGGGGGGAPRGGETWAPAPKTRSADPTTSTDNWESVEADDDEVHILSEEHVGKLTSWPTFGEVKFPQDLVAILTDGNTASFEKPTQIQSWVWPSAMKKEDVIGVAKTGSGKTLAYLLPAFIHIKFQQTKGVTTDWAHGPLCVVLAPTRELCQQIYEESVKFGTPAGISTAVAYGGTTKQTQLRTFSYDNPAVAVVCPGRFRDFVSSGDINVSNVDYVILDEADRMLDMGFEWEIREILGNFKEERQSMLFSATFPAEVKKLARKLCYRDAVHIQIGSSDPLTGNKDIHQEIDFCSSEHEKRNKIYEIISQHWDTETKWWKEGEFKYLVFANTKRECSELAGDFSNWGIDACALHGDLSQWQRDESLAKLKNGKAKVLFATDVASRGLDIQGVTCVINYSPPGSVEDYVHRIGRTGRAGQKGRSLTLLLPNESYKVKDIVMVMKKTGQAVPDELRALAKEAGYGGKGYGRGGRW